MRISDWSSDVCSSDRTCPCPVNRCFQDKPQPSFCASNIEPMPARGESAIRSLRGRRSNGPISWHSHIWVLISRSEEHTSELQSLMRISYAVFCLKKNNTTNNI